MVCRCGEKDFAKMPRAREGKTTFRNQQSSGTLSGRWFWRFTMVGGKEERALEGGEKKAEDTRTSVVVQSWRTWKLHQGIPQDPSSVLVRHRQVTAGGHEHLS